RPRSKRKLTGTASGIFPGFARVLLHLPGKNSGENTSVTDKHVRIRALNRACPKTTPLSQPLSKTGQFDKGFDKGCDKGSEPELLGQALKFRPFRQSWRQS